MEMDIQLEILKVLINYKEKIVKHNGWNSHKISKKLVNYKKEEVKIALNNLVDKKLVKVNTTRIKGVSYYFYMINEKGQNYYEKEIEYMNVNDEIKKKVEEDIKKLENINSMNFIEKEDYYIQLTSMYPQIINDFGNSLDGYYKDHDFYDVELDEKLLDVNFKRIKGKLQSFKLNGYKTKEKSDNNRTVYNNNLTANNINNNHNDNSINNEINLSFEDVRKKIKNMDNLSDTEYEEIQLKINEIEKIIKSSYNKRDKWSKLKPFIIWIADKGVEVGISLLPLLLNIK